MIRISEYLLSKDKTKLSYGEAPYSSFWQAIEKFPENAFEFEMNLKRWHRGEKTFSIKKWGDAKLVIAYKYCMNHKFQEELLQLEEEANRRGWSMKTIKF